MRKQQEVGGREEIVSPYLLHGWLYKKSAPKIIIAFVRLNVEMLQKFAFDGEAASMNAWKCSGLDSRALGRKEMVDDDNDVHVNACCLTKQLQSLLWNKVGCDFKIIEYITESFRSCQLQQLHSLMIDVDAESTARGDKHIY